MKPWLAGLLLLVPALTLADPAGVHTLTTKEPADQVYDHIHNALEGAKFWVVFEADMGSRIEKFAEDWGTDYNRNKLTTIKSMVFCSLWWTNQLTNLDPDLVGLCPLHLTVYARDGRTTVLWPKLSAMAEGSPGRDIALALDQEVSELVRGVVTPE